MRGGPSTRFRDYERSSTGERYAPATRPPRGRWAESLREVGTALVSLVLMVGFSEPFSYDRLIRADDVLHTWPLWRRILFVQGAGLVARFRFYGVWSLSNAACILSGLAYHGIDPATHHARWTRCKNVFVMQIALAHNMKEVLYA